MRLDPGFVIGGRYRIERLIAVGSKFRVYEAVGEALGPGRVAVKVARHEGVSSLSGLQAGRAQVESSWANLKLLHENASSAAPLPLELVHMYPGDPAVRRVALQDKSVVKGEPYLVCELVRGESLLEHGIVHERLDEERAVQLALRVALIVRSALRAGLVLTDLSATNFLVDRAGENVSIVDPSAVAAHRPPPAGDLNWGPLANESQQLLDGLTNGERMPPSFGRLLISLLAGVAAPQWGATEADRERWETLLVRRRVPPEFHHILLGCLGYFDAFEATPERVEQRLRALVRARPARVYTRQGKTSDTPYLIHEGEIIADRFEVLGPLGQGGRGFVYRALDRRSGVKVLIKANKYQYDSGSAFALELPTRRLELEHEFDVLVRFAADTGMLPQPVALVYGRGRGAWFDLAPVLSDREPYLVMEWIKGIPLLDLLPAPYEGANGWQIPGNRLSPGMALRLIGQVAEVLQTFHDAGYLVQDLKPENILYDPGSENVYMVDLAAVCPREVDGLLDRESVAFGTQTHGFAAPEFGELWERCDDRFDIYSLGATALHLMTGVNPERVALETGEEYPTLPLHGLHGLAPIVAEVVTSCLAEPAQRFPSAEAATIAAERARLFLSRSRPLDVRAVTVGYEAEGARFSWFLPVDPRLHHMRIVRLTAVEEVVYDGEMIEEWIDTDTIVDDRNYRIQTALLRGGEVLHSRGRVIRREARPAPVIFEVTPYFGGNRVRIALAAHATSAIVRVSGDAPPMGAGEGEELTVSPTGDFVCPSEPDVDMHFAAFARYGDVVSAGRFATSSGFAPVEPCENFVASQTTEGVVMSWQSDADYWVVVAGLGGAERPLSVDESGVVVDTALSANESEVYSLLAEVDGVRSAPVGQLRVTRWPAIPDVSAVPTAGSVTLDVSEGFDAFYGAVLRWTTATARSKAVPLEALPVLIRVPSDEPVTLELGFVVAEGATGPSWTTTLVVPSREPSLTLRQVRDVLPLEFVVEVGSDALSWTGDYGLRVERDELVLQERSGPPSEWLDEEGKLSLVEDSLAFDDRHRWRATLLDAEGKRIAVSEVVGRVFERLPAPQVESALGSVHVVVDDDWSFDVETSFDAQKVLHHRVSGSQPLPVREGAACLVRWRRASDMEPPQPWSEPTASRSLIRPSVPLQATVELAEGVPCIRWRTTQPNTKVLITTLDGRRVFEGIGESAVDVSPGGAEGYRVCSMLDDLLSEPVETQRLADRSPGRTRSVVRSAARACVGDVRLLQYVSVNRDFAVLEMVTPEQDVTIRAVAAVDSKRFSAGAVVAAIVPTRVRTLLPVPASCRVNVVVSRGARTGTCASAIEPVSGKLLPVASREEGGFSLRRAVPEGETLTLVRIGPSGILERFPSTLDESRLSLTVDEDALLGSSLAAESTGGARLLVALGGDANEHPIERIWFDAAMGVSHNVLHLVSRQWRASVVSRVIGVSSQVNVLKDGAHLCLEIGWESVDSRGRARFSARIRGPFAAERQSFSVRLAEPATLTQGVSNIVRWVVESQRTAAQPAAV